MVLLKYFFSNCMNNLLVVLYSDGNFTCHLMLCFGRNYQNETYVTIRNESLRTCPFFYTYDDEVYIKDFSHNSCFPLVLSS